MYPDGVAVRYGLGAEDRHAIGPDNIDREPGP